MKWGDPGSDAAQDSLLNQWPPEEAEDFTAPRRVRVKSTGQVGTVIREQAGYLLVDLGRVKGYKPSEVEEVSE